MFAYVTLLGWNTARNALRTVIFLHSELGRAVVMAPKNMCSSTWMAPRHPETPQRAVSEIRALSATPHLHFSASPQSKIWVIYVQSCTHLSRKMLNCAGGLFACEYNYSHVKRLLARETAAHNRRIPNFKAPTVRSTPSNLYPGKWMRRDSATPSFAHSVSCGGHCRSVAITRTHVRVRPYQIPLTFLDISSEAKWIYF